MQYFIINTLVAYLGITLFNSVTGNENFISEEVVIGAITIIIFRLIEYLLEEKQYEK